MQLYTGTVGILYKKSTALFLHDAFVSCMKFVNSFLFFVSSASSANLLRYIPIFNSITLQQYIVGSHVAKLPTVSLLNFFLSKGQ